MPPSSGNVEWLPLSRLAAQFQANLAAIAGRYPQLAADLAALPACRSLIRANGDSIEIGHRSANGDITVSPNPVPPSSAAAVAAKLFPTGSCTQPVLIAGLDQGWLWSRLQQLPISTPAAPGHRPPLYFLCRDIDRLQMVLHLHDWRALLGDGRVRLFCGDDAIAQFRAEAIENPQHPLPRLSVTVDPQLWKSGETLDTLLRDIVSEWEQRFAHLTLHLQSMDQSFDPSRLATQMRCGEPLKIFGITSRFTTFLQYSMRDWLDGLRSMGHETSLLMESADHESIHPITIAARCDVFQPDLIVMIDHYRAELKGIPLAIPSVMWVQDRLPNIFNANAGAAQQPTDYVIGQGRTDCVHIYGYPSSRFMPAMIGTNPARFSSDEVTPEFDCDVSFISHCSTPAEKMIDEDIQRLNSPHATRLLGDIFDQLKQIYATGGSITQQYKIEALIRQTIIGTRTSVPDLQPLIDLFTHRINNALYRHQAIGWVAEMDINLRLYGRGWDQHPQFSRFACGVADNEKQLASIYRRSRINLQVTPFGAAHQRLFDGLAAGGFFLMRRCSGDRFDQTLRKLAKWCEAQQITTDVMLLARADDNVRDWLAELNEIDGKPVMGRGYDFVSEMMVTADEGFIRSAGTIWPEFDAVSFDSREELQAQIQTYLVDAPQRASLIASMRQRVLESLTYRAVSERMLKMIGDDLAASVINRAA
ncbi:MAG: glycosyltransferase family 1 protein [Phycisphaerae bacterium]|nr:glycosyltransferase family 1 protein [Phycisphaerae bacterium]